MLCGKRNTDFTSSLASLAGIFIANARCVHASKAIMKRYKSKKVLFNSVTFDTRMEMRVHSHLIRQLI